ncbi:MAG TPA: alpha/beta fold hydrolase [Anaerolineales bacterium]|nr:alpha/beta fold hydrolase [Anaerolineales bacterium]
MNKPRGLKHREIQLDLNLYRVEVPVAGISGASLSVIDIKPESAEKAIIFLHGYAGCAETWEYQINHFAHQYRVIVPDLRGHGQSDAPYTEYTMPELIADINAIANHLKLPEKFILVGHSFGGSICIEYAAAHPERLEKLVLIATAGEYPLPRSASMLSRIPVAVFRPFWRFRPRWNAEVHVMKRMMLNNMRKWIGWDKMHLIKTPTMVMTGERDRYFPRWTFDRVSESIEGVEIVDVGSSKHKVQLERHQAVNRSIERFIQISDPNGRKSSWREMGVQTKLSATRPWLKSYGKYTPISCPIPDQPLHRFLEAAAQKIPKRRAVVFYGNELTYQQLDRRANQFAHALHGLGVRPGERVMIVLPNIPQMIIAYFATLKIGGVVVLPNPDADARQIFSQLEETQAKVLVTLKDFAGLAIKAQERLPLKVVLANIRGSVSSRVFKNLMGRWQQAGFDPEESSPWVEEATTIDRLMLDASPENPKVPVSADDLAAILYTSGTTDEPKGVCLTHKNLVANSLQTRHWIPDIQYGEETFLAVLPLTHSYGMTTAMNIPIAIGATIVLLPVFELQQVLEHIKEFKPTVFPGVPSIYAAINQARGLRNYGLDSIKACISGAAPLPVEVQEAFEKLSRARLVEGYGLTEASPVTHANPLRGVTRTGSIGIPIPDTDARIVDLVTGEDLAPGNIGELLVKGPQVMNGYWKSDQTISPDSAFKDGWLYTGDVAVMDSDGFFTIISRKRDTIMAGEFSVYPRDVEEVLYENSKVLEAAVVGVSTGGSGQKIKAFVVPRPGTNLSKEELMEQCRRRLEEYAVPWEIEFRDELPKSFVGKVLRRMLVED